MGTVPILDFRGLPQSRAQGHGELGPPHPCRVGGKRRLVQDGTGLRYLAVVSEYNRLGWGLALLSTCSLLVNLKDEL